MPRTAAAALAACLVAAMVPRPCSGAPVTPDWRAAETGNLMVTKLTDANDDGLSGCVPGSKAFQSCQAHSCGCAPHAAARVRALDARHTLETVSFRCGWCTLPLLAPQLADLYLDQPYCVVSSKVVTQGVPRWVCTITRNQQPEGHTGEHSEVLYSDDRGATWTTGIRLEAVGSVTNAYESRADKLLPVHVQVQVASGILNWAANVPAWFAHMRAGTEPLFKRSRGDCTSSTTGTRTM
jgi:hypothetical protein